MPTDPKVSSIAYVLIRTLDRTSVIKKPRVSARIRGEMRRTIK